MNLIDKLDLKYKIVKLRERIQMKIVWSLPRRLIMWAVMRAMAHATSGRWGNEVVSFDMPVKTLIDRWEIV